MTIRLHRFQLFVVTATFCGVALSQAGPSNVTVTPFNTRPVVVFDPTRPNGAPVDNNHNLPGPPVDADGNPLIPPGLNAVTNCEVGFTTTGNMVTVTGTATIYVPVGNDSVLLGHERGHAFLCGREYGENAESKLILATHPSMTFGTTLNEAADRGAAAVSQQMGVIGDKFDLLTDNGRSPTVNTARAVRELLKERDEARKQSVYKVPSGIPNPVRVWGGTADPPCCSLIR